MIHYIRRYVMLAILGAVIFAFTSYAEEAAVKGSYSEKGVSADHLNALRLHGCQYIKGRLCVEREFTIPAPPSAVWHLVGDFNEWDEFLTVVDDSAMTGFGIRSVRFLELAAGGGLAVERLDAHSNLRRLIAYSILDSPLPVDNYHAVMRVRQAHDDPQSSLVRWSSIFVADGVADDEAVATIDGIYDVGLRDLAMLYTPVVSVDQAVEAAADDVWDLVGNFNGWNLFLSAVETSERIESGNKVIRVLTLVDNSRVIEELECLEEDRRRITYTINMALSLPVQHYRATMTVTPDGPINSIVNWEASFVAKEGSTQDEAEEFIEGFFTNGLAELAAMF